MSKRPRPDGDQIVLILNHTQADPFLEGIPLSHFNQLTEKQRKRETRKVISYLNGKSDNSFNERTLSRIFRNRQERIFTRSLLENTLGSNRRIFPDTRAEWISSLLAEIMILSEPEAEAKYIHPASASSEANATPTAAPTEEALRAHDPASGTAEDHIKWVRAGADDLLGSVSEVVESVKSNARNLPTTAADIMNHFFCALLNPSRAPELPETENKPTTSTAISAADIPVFNSILDVKMSQTPLLNKGEGICYGLSLMMAITLMDKDLHAVQSLANNLALIGDRRNKDISSHQRRKLKDAMQHLNRYANTFLRLDTQNIRFSIYDICVYLESAEETQMYKFGTPNHAMLVGVKVEGDKRTYFIYDPNTGIKAFNHILPYKVEMAQHFDAARLELYNVPINENKVHLFELAQINRDFLPRIIVKFETASVNINAFSNPDFPNLLMNLERQALELENIEGALARITLQEVALSGQESSQENEQRRIRLSQTKQALNAQKGELDKKLFINKDENSPYDEHIYIASADEHADDLKDFISGFEVQNGLQKSISFLEASKVAQQFYQATVALYQAHQIDSTWLPQLGSMQQVNDQIDLTFYDPADIHGKTIRIVQTNSTAILKAKKFLDEHFVQFKNAFSLDANGKPYVPAHLGDDTAGINSLNAACGLQILISLIQEHRREQAVPDPIAENLAIALKVHTYVSIAQISQGVYQDVKQLIDLVKQLKAPSSSISQFSRALGQVALAVDLGLNMASVGLSTYEYIHAENEIQKSVFGTQLSFDSAGLLINSTSLAASFLAAPGSALAIAGVFTGYLAVPLAGLSIGLSGLAQAYGEVSEDEKRVCEQLCQIRDSYLKGYVYDKANSRLISAVGAVIKKLDLDAGLIEFESQYICATRDVKSFYVSDAEKAKSTQLRTALELPSYANIDATEKYAEVVILPSTPKSYIAWYSQPLIGLKRKQKGYDWLAQIKKNSDGKFKYGNNKLEGTIVRSIDHAYELTEVEVLLDDRNRILVTADLPQVISGGYYENGRKVPLKQSESMKYHFKAKNAHYTILLNEAAQYQLSTEAGMTTRWSFDTSALQKDEVLIKFGQLIIGEIIIDIPAEHNSGAQISVFKQDGEVWKIDIATQTHQVLQIDAAKWSAKNLDKSLDSHIQNLLAQNQIAGPQLIIDHYVHQNQQVGRAFYDWANRRMLFTQPDRSDLDTSTQLLTVLKNAELGPSLGDHTFFYNQAQGLIWKTDHTTRKIVAQYVLPDEIRGQDIQVNLVGDQVYVLFEHRSWHGHKTRLVYQIENESIRLTEVYIDLKSLSPETSIATVLGLDFGAVSGSQELISNSDTNGGQSVRDKKFVEKLLAYIATVARQTDFFTFAGIDAVQANVAPLIPIYGKNSEGTSYHYWLRNGNPAHALIKPNIAYAKRNGHTLQLLGEGMRQPDGTEVFYFFDTHTQILYRQEGSDTQKRASNLSAQEVNIEKLSRVYGHDNYLIALAESGLIYRISVDQQITMVGVNETWLKAQGSAWHKNLQALGGQLLQVFGLTMTVGDQVRPINAWSHQGKLMLAPSLQGKKITFQNLDSNKTSAYLLDNDSGALYKQAILSEADLNKAFGVGLNLLHQQHIQAASRILPTLGFASVAKKEGHWEFVTTEGLLLHFNDQTNKAYLVGANQAWQQAHQTDMLTALKSLNTQTAWTANEAIALFGSLGGAPAWYHFRLGRKIILNDLRAEDKPQYLGSTAVSLSGESTIYFRTATGVLSYFAQVNDVVNSKKILLGEIYRFGNSVLQSGTDADDTMTPLLLNRVSSVVLSGGEGVDVYQINQAAREKIRYFLIHNHALDQQVDKLLLTVDDKAKVSHWDDDLIISDNYGAVLIKGVLGVEKTLYAHLELQISVKNVTLNCQVADLVNHFKPQELSYLLSSLPLGNQVLSS